MSQPRRVLITGCSSGIGRALAQTLSERGLHVIATARNPAALEPLDAAQKLALDVTSKDSVAAAVATAGDIDVLVNNAGIGLWGPLEGASLDQVHRLFDTNVYGPLRMLRAVLPRMRQRRSGTIIQISSVAGRVSGPLVGIYAASKQALEACSEALRIELAPFNIGVAIVEIGAVESAFPKNRESAGLSGYDEVTERFTRRLMAARTAPATSDEVARAIADIVQAETVKLRYMATADAERLIAERHAQSDEQWERALLDG